MDHLLILVKCITLLFRESQLENITENSADLVRTAIEKIETKEINIGVASRRSTLAALKDMVDEMCRMPASHRYEATELLQQAKLATCNDDNIYQSIVQGIENELQPPVLKRTITNLKKAIADFYRENKIGDILRRASRDYNFNRNGIRDPQAWLNNLMTEISVLTTKTTAKDHGLIKSLDLGDDESVKNVFIDVAASAGEDLSFKTGFIELDEALQGGPRPGDTIMMSALQHEYKTGMNLSLFANIAIYNVPKNKDPNKKPCCYRITGEDPLRNNAQFIYQLLKYQETGEAVDVKNITVEEMSSFVKKRLSVNGYYVLMDEVNPTTWTYQSIINRVIDLESQGYAVEVLCIDYLSKFSMEGCTQGAIGDDMMDLLSKLRAYAAANGILFITPHQLSTEAKRLLQTVPTDQFLHYIKGGGFYEKSKGLDRIYDIGLLLHKVEMPSGDYLHVVIDKHRFPTVVDSSKKSFYLAFPKNKMPIPSNYGIPDYKALRKIPKFVATSKDEALFDF